MAYEPTAPQGITSVEDLANYLYRELQQIGEAIAGVERIQLVAKNAEPAKRRDGQIEYADGTNWNPGGGRGVYRWEDASSSWKLLG